MPGLTEKDRRLLGEEFDVPLAVMDIILRLDRELRDLEHRLAGMSLEREAARNSEIYYCNQLTAERQAHEETKRKLENARASLGRAIRAETWADTLPEMLKAFADLEG